MQANRQTVQLVTGSNEAPLYKAFLDQTKFSQHPKIMLWNRRSMPSSQNSPLDPIPSQFNQDQSWKLVYFRVHVNIILYFNTPVKKYS
jgi:hypothetical protein